MAGIDNPISVHDEEVMSTSTGRIRNRIDRRNSQNESDIDLPTNNTAEYLAEKDRTDYFNVSWRIEFREF